MVVELTKGAKVELHKDNPTLKIAKCGLGWDIAETPGVTFDLDLFMVECGVDGKSYKGDSIDAVIFYAHKENANKSIYVGPDNLTGVGEGYDEEGFIDFDKVPAEIDQIFACVSIYKYKTKKQNFGQVNNAACDIVDNATQDKLVRYDLTEDMSSGSGVIVGRFKREPSGWSFKAVGELFNDGMPGILKKFGITTSGGE